MIQIEGATSIVLSNSNPPWYGPDWQVHLLDCCMADCNIICLSFLCPPAQLAKNTFELTDGNQNGTSCCVDFMGLSCCYLSNQVLYRFLAVAPRRGMMRRLMGIKGDPCNDYLVHCFCHCCALVQEHKEIQIRKRQGFSYLIAGNHINCECKQCIKPPQTYVMQ